MTGVDRAANLLQARLSWPQAEGCAKDLADAGMLATSEAKDLLDLVIAYDRHEIDWDETVADAVTAYLASRGET